MDFSSFLKNGLRYGGGEHWFWDFLENSIKKYESNIYKKWQHLFLANYLENFKKKNLINDENLYPSFRNTHKCS